MGHYTEVHMEEQRLANARMRRRLLEQYVRLNKAIEEIKSAVWTLDDNIPIKSVVKDLEGQFVLWCVKEELLVEDPQIVIDLLKDKE